MTKINNRVEFLESYFDGFKDIYHHESAKKVTKGLLKVASYCVTLLVLPAIVGFALLIAKYEAKKEMVLIERVKETIKNGEEAQTVNEVGTGILKLATEDEIIDFLMLKIEDNAFDETFQKAFKRVNFQEKFFLRVIAANKLGEVLDALPKDIKELKFNCGLKSKWLEVDVEKYAANAKLFISKIASFPDLEKLELNFKGIGRFTKQCESHLENVTGLINQFKTVHIGVSGEVEYVFVEKAGIHIKNRTDLIKQTITELLLALKNVPASLKQVTAEFEGSVISIHQGKTIKNVYQIKSVRENNTYLPDFERVVTIQL